MLVLIHLIHTGRDNQNNNIWRGMVSNLSEREGELIGKTLLIVAMGAAGSQLLRFAKAFDMKVLATKRDPSTAVDLRMKWERLPGWLRWFQRPILLS